MVQFQTPLKPIRNEDGIVNVESAMRYYRAVRWSNTKRYVLETFEHWPEEKLPPVEVYSTSEIRGLFKVYKAQHLDEFPEIKSPYKRR